MFNGKLQGGENEQVYAAWRAFAGLASSRTTIAVCLHCWCSHADTIAQAHDNSVANANTNTQTYAVTLATTRTRYKNYGAIR